MLLEPDEELFNSEYWGLERAGDRKQIVGGKL